MVLPVSASGDHNVAMGDSAGFNNTGSNNICIGRRAGFYETSDNKLYVGSDSNETIIYGDMITGQLLLGMRQPAGYTFKSARTLNVLGGVLADSVRVALSGNWADYVFEENYNLQPLEELGKFIETNKHLPGIPTTKEVAANGIELGSMNAKLLAKIEELTLYLLQQQKEIQELKKALLEKKWCSRQK
jgi:hypothetical protein